MAKKIFKELNMNVREFISNDGKNKRKIKKGKQITINATESA